MTKRGLVLGMVVGALAWLALPHASVAQTQPAPAPEQGGPGTLPTTGSGAAAADAPAGPNTPNADLPTAQQGPAVDAPSREAQAPDVQAAAQAPQAQAPQAPPAAETQPTEPSAAETQPAMAPAVQGEPAPPPDPTPSDREAESGRTPPAPKKADAERHTIAPTFETALWISVIGSGTALAVGTLFGVRAASLKDDALALPSRHPERRGIRERVVDAENIADVAFITAGAFAAGAVVVLLTQDASQDSAPRVGAAFGPGRAQLFVGGSL